MKENKNVLKLINQLNRSGEITKEELNIKMKELGINIIFK